ncbi:MAG: dihydroorotate dehydrogenase [Gemmatimonadota bacterium]
MNGAGDASREGDVGGETVRSGDDHLTRNVFGTNFRNPVLLAAGTCGFGREVHEVVDLERLGGLVTKSVTLEPRWGNPPPRVTEFGAGMLNSVGLTNPGAEAVRDRELPWLRDHLRRTRILVSVAGHTPGEYVRIVELLDDSEGFLGYEINLSCPNDTRLEDVPFALDPDAVRDVLGRVRERTQRPVVAKLAPNDPRLPDTVRVAEDAGVDGITLVNTLPGLALDPETGRPRLGAGPGGVSGPALRPVGVRAVAEAVAVTSLPVLGVGGVASAADALEYLRAGATLVQVGTASFADPRVGLRIAEELEKRARRMGGLPSPESARTGIGTESGSPADPRGEAAATEDVRGRGDVRRREKDRAGRDRPTSEPPVSSVAGSGKE